MPYPGTHGFRKVYFKKDGTRTQMFPGLTVMAPTIARQCFPASDSYDVYVEPFCGRAKTAEYVPSGKKLHLNDLDKRHVDYCAEKFASRHPELTQVDGFDVLELHRTNPRAFVVLDPPWEKLCYLCTKRVPEYYSDLLERLRQPDTRCKWLLLGSIAKQRAQMPNSRTIRSTRKIFNGTFGVRYLNNYSDFSASKDIGSDLNVSQ